MLTRSSTPLPLGSCSRISDHDCKCGPSLRTTASSGRCFLAPRTKSIIAVESEEYITVDRPINGECAIDRSNVHFPNRRHIENSVLDIEESWSKTNAEVPEASVLDEEPGIAASRKSSKTKRKLWSLDSLSNRIKGAAEKGIRNNALLKTLAKDKQIVTDWTMKTALPVISEALLLMNFEEPSAVPLKRQVFEKPSYPTLSGWDLVAADISTIRQYFDQAKLQLAIWQLPLQQTYEPAELATYFNARPHILLFRALEVSAAFSYLLVWYMFERTMTMRWKSPSEEEALKLTLKTAEIFKQTVLKLGPTFTKVAQSLSTRSDLIGPDSAKVLADLQDRLPPFPNDEAMALVERELGRPISEMFTFISKEPVAAASLGQVYRAVTIDGQDVAVKVQRPDILHSIACDVYLLRLGLGLVRKVAGINSDLSVFADEIGKGLYGELDYRLEAENAACFSMALKPKLDFVVVPKALPPLTTRKVITMEWIAGTRPVDLRRVANGQEYGCSLEEQGKARQRLLEMVDKGVQSSLTQLLDAGILHADPHPGNIIYTSENSIGYLDFGLICRLEKKHQYAMIAATAHLVNGDWGFLVDDLAEMDVVKPSTSRFRLRLALEDSLSDLVVRDGLPDFKFSEIVAKLFKVALKFRFRLPPYYTLILRSIASLEGMALAVDPNFKVFTKTYPFVVHRLLSDNSSSMRRILRTLLLTSKKEFRWERVASFMSIQGAVSRENVSNDPPLESTLLKLILSSNGAALRRVLLEADTRSLAQAFISKEAAPTRLKIASILTDAFHLFGKQILQQHAGIEIPAPNSTLVSSATPVLKSKHLQFVLSVLLNRLQATPLLMLRVGATAVTVLSWSFAAALHRLAVAISDACLNPVQSIPQTAAA